MPTSLQLNNMGNLFLYITAFLGAFIAALWISLVFWAYRDARQRSDDRIARILAGLVVAVLGPPGLVIYLILRPPQTLDESYQRTLEEEALLREIEHQASCPGCGAQPLPSWQLCPSCHTRLRKPCTSCGELMELSWQVCPNCAQPAPGARRDREPDFEPVEVPES